MLVAAVVLGEYRTVSLSAPVDRQPRYLSLRYANEQDNDGRGTDSWQAPLVQSIAFFRHTGAFGTRGLLKYTVRSHLAQAALVDRQQRRR